MIDTIFVEDEDGDAFGIEFSNEDKTRLYIGYPHSGVYVSSKMLPDLIKSLQKLQKEIQDGK